MRSLLCGALLSLMVGCGSSSTGEGVNRGSSGGSSNGGSGNSPALGGSPGSGATSSSQGGNRTGTGGAGAVSGNGGVASTAGGTGNTAGNGGIMLGVGGGGVITPTGETQCDGIDNDGNGIIDDVDVGSDGVCDCLNIATIGRLGLWSTGTGIFTTWINARSPLGVTALGDQDLTTVNLSQFQVIVLLNVVTYDWTWRGGAKSEVGVASHPYSAAESSALATWVSNGGGLLTTIGYTPSSAELADFNRLLSALDVGYTGWDVVAGQVTNWAPHPVT
ncbi:MAG TPA: hypothetical protein VGJ84_06215, partial [Polyangiaceae bacterium]